MVLGFLLYAGCCLVFIALGLYAMFSKKPVGIWAYERKSPRVKDACGYNRAVAKLFIGYGIVLLLCGLPILLDANPALLMLVSVLGVAFASIILVVFAVKIEGKYRIR